MWNRSLLTGNGPTGQYMDDVSMIVGHRTLNDPPQLLTDVRVPPQPVFHYVQPLYPRRPDGGQYVDDVPMILGHRTLNDPPQLLTDVRVQPQPVFHYVQPLYPRRPDGGHRTLNDPPQLLTDVRVPPQPVFPYVQPLYPGRPDGGHRTLNDPPQLLPDVRVPPQPVFHYVQPLYPRRPDGGQYVDDVSMIAGQRTPPQLLTDVRVQPQPVFPYVQPLYPRRPDGGIRNVSLTPAQEKCYNPHDPTLKFVDADDDLDFLCEGFQSHRALMSCGHAVTPMSLTNWCRRLLDEGKSRFVCGQSGCNVEWPFSEVCKMALLTPEEKRYFEKTLASNAARDSTKLCPKCKSSVVRTNPSNLKVRCPLCPFNKGRIFEFCWQCLREWKGPAPRSDQCGNDGCTNESLKTLRHCPDMYLKSVKCPSIRACPTCGILLQHDNTLCKNVDCPRCHKQFCFVCLKMCLGHKCSGAAPRQTSIPVWHKK